MPPRFNFRSTRHAFGFDRLGDELAQNDLLREVLRADDDPSVSEPRRGQARSEQGQENHGGDGDGPTAVVEERACPMRRSTHASRPSAVSASAAAGIAPASIVVVSTIDSPRKMYSPRPPAPIAAAIVAVPTPMTVATRMPAMIDGKASGSSTSHSSWRPVIPIATPASITARSIWRIPETVVRMIGSTA